MDENQKMECNSTEAEGKSKNGNKKEEENAFKERLVVWLKDNEVKLSPKHSLDIPSSSTNLVTEAIGIMENTGIEPKGNWELT